MMPKYSDVQFKLMGSQKQNNLIAYDDAYTNLFKTLFYLISKYNLF